MAAQRNEVPMHPSAPRNLNLSQTPAALTTPGGFGRRFAAAILDAFCMTLLTTPISLAIQLGLPLALGSRYAMQATALTLILSQIASWTFLFFWVGWFYSNKGATPGKLLLGLKVVRSDNGAHVGYWRAFFRETIGKLCSFLVLGAGFLMVLFREDKRALHDVAVGTQVLRVKR